MKTILAPVDFSPATDGVCKAAATLAKAVNARVILLHSIAPPVITSEYGGMMENVAELTAITEGAATKQLARLQAEMEREFVVTETLKINGPAVAAVIEHAEKMRADYIVLGSHGHSAFYELLVGSTAHGILMKATCPVLIVPPPRTKPKEPVRESPPEL